MLRIYANGLGVASSSSCKRIIVSSTSLSKNTFGQLRMRTSTSRARHRKNIRKRPLSSSKQKKKNDDDNYGLIPVDYTKVVPDIYYKPPPPPPRPGAKRWYFPATLITTLAFAAYFAINNQNDAYEYWDAMQQGNLPSEFLDDDEFDDDDDDEFDDEKKDE